MLIFLSLLPSLACQYVTTIAGNGHTKFNDGQGSEASFFDPWGVSVDQVGNVYVSDYYNNRIRKINTTGYVSTLAGSGLTSYADGQGINAHLNRPVGLFADSHGNVYVSDNNNQRIRKIDSTGYVSTVAGSGNVGSDDGQSVSATFCYPFGVAVDTNANIYLADQWNNRVRMINSSGYVHTIAGSGADSLIDGQGLSATLNSPNGISLDAAGNVYVGDFYNHVIRKINTTGYVSTYAGNGYAGYSDGPSGRSSFNGPCGVSMDHHGNLFVADSMNNRVRVVNATGYVKTIAGSSNKAFHDGPGLRAGFNYPRDVAVDSVGRVIVADTLNNRIRRIDFDTHTPAPTINSPAITFSFPTPSVNPVPTNPETDSLSTAKSSNASFVSSLVAGTIVAVVGLVVVLTRNRKVRYQKVDGN